MRLGPGDVPRCTEGSIDKNVKSILFEAGTVVEKQTLMSYVRSSKCPVALPLSMKALGSRFNGLCAELKGGDYYQVFMKGDKDIVWLCWNYNKVIVDAKRFTILMID